MLTRLHCTAGIPTVLVANKCDLLPKSLETGDPDLSASPVVDEIMHLAKGLGFIDWELVSARDDQNVAVPFATVAKEAEKLPPPKTNRLLNYDEFVVKKQRGYRPAREPQACGC